MLGKRLIMDFDVESRINALYAQHIKRHINDSIWHQALHSVYGRVIRPMYQVVSHDIR